MCSLIFRVLLVSFLQCSNEFSLLCDYKITMIYIDMFKFLLHICQCQTLPSFLLCWMLLKCPFVPMCEGYYLFYVLLRNHNDLVFSHLCHHQNMVFLFSPNFLIIFSLCHFSFFHVSFLQKFVICSIIFPLFLYV
jgi:hypothetical protein